MLDKAEAQKIVDSLRLEKRDVDRELAALRERSESFDQVIAGLVGLFPDLAASDARQPNRLGTLTMGEAFRQILTDLPDTWFTIIELIAEMEARQIGPDASEPEAAGRAALRRLLKDEVVVRRPRSGRAYEYRLFSIDALLEGGQGDDGDKNDEDPA